MRISALICSSALVFMVGCDTQGKKFEQSVVIYNAVTVKMLDLQGKYFEIEYPALNKENEVARLRDYLRGGMKKAEDAKKNREADPIGWLSGSLLHWLEIMPTEQGLGNTTKGQEVAQEMVNAINQAINQLRAIQSA